MIAIEQCESAKKGIFKGQHEEPPQSRSHLHPGVPERWEGVSGVYWPHQHWHTPATETKQFHNIVATP